MQALTSEFAQLLTQLLYGQPDLRPAVLRALRAMVDSNVTAAASEEVDGERKTRAERNVVFLRTQAPSWLAVLFNVFGSVERDARAGVGDVIASWIGVAGDAVRTVSRIYCSTVLTDESRT
jgi:ribosomal RNA-processing protein 12